MFQRSTIVELNHNEYLEMKTVWKRIESMKDE